MAAASCGEGRRRQAHKAHASLLTPLGSALTLAAAASFSYCHCFATRNPTLCQSFPRPSPCACILLEDTHHVAMASVVIASMDLIHRMYSTPLACSILRLSSLSQGLEERPRELEVQSNWSPWNNQHPCLSLGRSSAGRIYLLWCGFAIQCRNINALRIFFFFASYLPLHCSFKV